MGRQPRRRHVERVARMEVIGMVEGVGVSDDPQIPDGRMMVMVVVVVPSLRRVMSVPVPQRHRNAFRVNHLEFTTREELFFFFSIS